MPFNQSRYNEVQLKFKRNLPKAHEIWKNWLARHKAASTQPTASELKSFWQDQVGKIGHKNIYRMVVATDFEKLSFEWINFDQESNELEVS